MTFSVFAQRPGEGDKLISFGLLNNTGFLMLKCYKDTLKANRFGLSGNYYTRQNETQDVYSPQASYLNKKTSSESNYNVGVFFGKQRSFTAFKNFEPYLGCDIGISLGSGKTKSKTEVTDTLYSKNGILYPPSFLIGDYSKMETRNPVVVGATIMPFLGFNFFLFKNFALGAEYRISVARFNYSFGGLDKFESRQAGVLTNSTETKHTKEFSGGINLQGSGYITASYYFR